MSDDGNSRMYGIARQSGGWAHWQPELSPELRQEPEQYHAAARGPYEVHMPPLDPMRMRDLTNSEREERGRQMAAAGAGAETMPGQNYGYNQAPGSHAGASHPNAGSRPNPSGSRTNPGPTQSNLQSEPSNDSLNSDDEISWQKVRHRDRLGEIHSRHVTDSRMSYVFWLVVISAFLCAGYCGNRRGVSMSLGDIPRLLNYQGLACGWASDVENLPYLYYPLETSHAKDSQISRQQAGLSLRSDRGMCVARCPTTSDVAAKGVIGVPEVGYAADESAGSAVSLLYNIYSPLYASVSLGNNMCFPLDSDLQMEFLKMIRKSMTLGDARYYTGGIIRSVPTSSLAILFAIIFGILLTVLTRTAAGALIMTSFISIVTLCFFSGTYLIGYSLTNTNGHKMISKLFSTHFYTTLWSGSILFSVGMILTILSILNWKHLSSCCRMLKVTKISLEDNNGVLNFTASILSVIIMLQISIFLFGLVSIVSGLSKINIDTPGAMLSLNPNGGISIMPLHRISTYKLINYFILGLWIFANIWVLETIIVLSNFVGIYSGCVAASSVEKSGNDGVESEGLIWTPLSIAIVKHCGTMVSYSAARFISRPANIFFFGVATRFQLAKDSVGNCLDVMELFGDVDRGTFAFLRDWIDASSNVGLAETAISGASFKAGQRRGLRVANQPHMQQPLCKYLGVGSLMTWVCCGLVGMTVFVPLCWRYLKQGPFGMPSIISSRGFLASPILAAGVAAVSAAAIIAPFFTVWASYGDGLLYMTLKRTLELSGGRGGPAVPFDAPEPLQQLLEGEIENMHE